MSEATRLVVSSVRSEGSSPSPPGRAFTRMGEAGAGGVTLAAVGCSVPGTPVHEADPIVTVATPSTAAR